MKKNREPEVTPEQFQKLLDDHDWRYQMSDDSYVYSNGLKNELHLQGLCANNQAFKKLYDAKWKEIFRKSKK